MPEKKNQHYVPQLLLRNFSNDGKSINLINLNTLRCIRNAAIKNQCSEDYFYGKDLKYEDALGDLEGVAQSLILGKIASGISLKQRSPDHHAMLVFTAFQAFRTRFMADTLNDSIDLMMKNLFLKEIDSGKVTGISPEDIKSAKIGINDVGKRILGFIAMGLPMLYDLEVKILLNSTTKSLILSDNPAVLYNINYIEITNICVTGMLSKGLMIIFPVTNRHCLIFYDKNAYKVGGKSHKPVVIQNTKDIDEINKLQILNCYNNVYFLDNDEKMLIQTIKEVYPYRRTGKAFLKESPTEKTDDGFQSIVHTKRNDIKYFANISFIKKRKDNQTYHLQYGNRDDTLALLFREFEEQVFKGKYKGSEWNKFLEDRRK